MPPLPQDPSPSRNINLTSSSAARSFSPVISWCLVVAAGTVVLKDEAGNAVTFPSVAAGTCLTGPFSYFTSTTSANVQFGDGAPPPSSASTAIAVGALYTSATSSQAEVDVALYGILADGTPMAAFSSQATSSPGVTLDNSKCVGLRWNNAATQTAVWLRLPIPLDLDIAAPAIVKVFAAKSGATSGDATTFTVTAFAQTVGALEDAAADIGGVTTAMTGTATAKTVQLCTLSIATPPTPSANLSMSIKPTNGLLGTDDVTVCKVTLQYTRKLLSP